MIFVLICTEGDVSEPAYLRALSVALGAQAPRSVSTNIEILPVPLGGNQGHVKLIEAANTAVARYSADEKNLVALAGKGDSIEKWLVVDHDDMERHGVEASQLRKDVAAAGYTLVINKPKFEFFVLAFLSDLAEAAKKQKDLTSGINGHIDTLNQEDEAKGFGKSMLMPHYSKKTHIANKLFGGMLNNHPSLIDMAANLEMDMTAECYTEMPKIIRRFLELYRKD